MPSFRYSTALPRMRPRKTCRSWNASCIAFTDCGFPIPDCELPMAIEDLWYKHAVLYCLDVEKYLDANGDGIGDFEGLGRRLDYLAGIGVTCLWLQPFYPSPNRD